jgi:sugar (pentulose or hexulose) kinase
MVAIDLGNSGGKSFFGEVHEGRLIFEEIDRFRNEPVFFYLRDEDGSRVERLFWDDTYLYRRILNSLQEFKKKYGSQLDSIGIDTWGPDGQFVNKNGELLGKIYCYRGHRLDRMIEKLTSQIPAQKIYDITGIQFQPFNISNQLLWFVQNRSYLLDACARFLPLPTIFYYLLGGEHTVDSTWASATQLMDIRTNQWSVELLSQLGIPISVMPKIVRPGTNIGRLFESIAADIGVNQARLTAVCSHDTASAFAAAPVKTEGDSIIISSGTWSLIGKLVRDPITTHEAMALNFSNEGALSSIRFLKNCMGLWIAQELRRTWREKDGYTMTWEEAVRLLKNAKPFTALIDPDARAFYNPRDMEGAVASFCKETCQEVPKERGTILRVVFESLALKYRVVKEQLEEITKEPNKAAFIVGGGSRNEVLNQFTANALAIPVHAGPEEATALGNILVQARALGVLSTRENMNDIITSACRIRQYSPEKTALWNKNFKRFLSILKNYEQMERPVEGCSLFT